MKNTSEKVDIYGHKAKFIEWKKEKKLEGISKTNQEVISEFLLDFERGQYVKGKRPSYIRLNNLKHRLYVITKLLEKHYQIEDIRETTSKQITELFNVLMRNGEIKNRYGQAYTSIPSYTNVFTTFWNYHVRKQELENNKQITDITKYVDNSPVKENSFVYLNEEEFKKLVNNATKPEHRVLLWFLYDSGIRSPSELLNVLVSDIKEVKDSNYLELDIRFSKTYARKIKLLL